MHNLLHSQTSATILVILHICIVVDLLEYMCKGYRSIWWKLDTKEMANDMAFDALLAN